MNRSITFFLVPVLSLVATATAQPLADRVPSDALIYVGWAGANSMGPGFEGSHFRAMAEAAEVPRIVNEIIPKLLERVVQEEPDAREPINMIMPIIEPMYRHATAIYVGPLDLTDQREPKPRLALLCEAGEHAAAMERNIEQALQQAGDMPFPVSVRTVAGNVVVLSVGDVKSLDAVVEGKAKEKALGGSKNFVSAMSMQKSPVVAAYVDTEAVVKLIDDAVGKSGDKDAQQKWPQVRDALGLRGLKSFAFAQGFDGKDWATHAFIEAPSPRPGILAALDAKPISDDALRAIPSTATMAGVARIDLAGLFDAVRDAVKKLDPRAGKEMEDAIAEANKTLGLDIRKDLLGSLGDEWSYFIAPEISGRGPVGAVVVNRLKDPARAPEVSDKLSELANKFIAEENRDEDVQISFKKAKVGGLTINYLAMPVVSPSWVIAGNNLYVGLYPQSVAPAAGHVAGKGKSILDNPDFVALRKRLGGEKAVSMQFYDLPKSAPTSYPLWMIASSFGKFGDMLGVDTPVMLLPPLATVTQHLAPAGSVSTVDEKGWHFRGVTPFPGATLLASETGGLLDAQAIPVLLGLGLPSMSKARMQAQQVHGLSNLRQIGLGLHMYAAEHQGKFPDKLSETLPYLDNNVALFVNPESGNKVTPALPGKEAADWVDNRSDYAYVLSGANFSELQSSSETIAVHEKPRPGDSMVSAVYADGHAETVYQARFTDQLERQKAATAKPGKKSAD